MILGSTAGICRESTTLNTKILLAMIQTCGLDFSELQRRMHAQILCHCTAVLSPTEGPQPSLHSRACSDDYEQTFYYSVPHCLIQWKIKKLKWRYFQEDMLNGIEIKKLLGLCLYLGLATCGT